MAEIKKIGILGGGMMGSDIALSCALAGYKVLVKELNKESAQSAYTRMVSNLKKWVSKGKLDIDDEAAKGAVRHITTTDSFDEFKDVDLVIEAIFEDPQTKIDNYLMLEKICPPHCIIASNTSSISITKLGACFEDSSRKEQFVGMHFFSPAVVMKLVEVVKGEETSQQTVDAAYDFCITIGKEPVKIVDGVGFIVNRILSALTSEAMRLYEEGFASPEDIDKACRLGLGHPVGPFALMDLASNDLGLKILRTLHEAYGERFRPRPSLVKKVDAGHFGIKAGKGWFTYNKG
ncbi:3-hydroxyacyl-CoA dehydrogenase [uncultured Desulfobacterium sp.]|uniref:3-hydroxyacyl-CoA dehydrogenase n=1 Tax=uncultured Desulfobacterium sp. TaxID=201089 RepID=A0A445MR45_9BACT|nr:3-hydroxyacyl-CoA dehydrogenase [uncultured Desulfobacterium sp.]